MSDFDGWIAAAGSQSLDEVISTLGDDPNRGAITTFSGVVRQTSDREDKLVKKLEVEAWEEKSSEAMKKIAQRIGEKHDLLGLRIVHFEGDLELGEPIVFVVISSAHRKEAFSALEDAIDAYKQDSPVWKKEIYTDGSGQWITTAKN